MQNIDIRNLPNWLKSSDFYQSIINENNNTIDDIDYIIPLEDRFITNLSKINNTEELFQIIEIIKFWGLNCIPWFIYDYLINNNSDPQVIEKIKTVTEETIFQSELLILCFIKEKKVFINKITYQISNPDEFLKYIGFLNIDALKNFCKYIEKYAITLLYNYVNVYDPHFIGDREFDSFILKRFIECDNVNCFKYYLNKSYNTTPFNIYIYKLTKYEEEIKEREIFSLPHTLYSWPYCSISYNYHKYDSLHYAFANKSINCLEYITNNLCIYDNNNNNSNLTLSTLDFDILSININNELVIELIITLKQNHERNKSYDAEYFMYLFNYITINYDTDTKNKLMNYYGFECIRNNNLNIFKLLHLKGMQITNNIIHFIIEHNKIDFIIYCIKNEPNLDFKTNIAYLHSCLMYDRREIIVILIDNGFIITETIYKSLQPRWCYIRVDILEYLYKNICIDNN